VRLLVAHLAVLAAGLTAACQRNEQAQAGSAADCARVGEVLASFEVGNLAQPDHRAAVVSKHRQACETAGVTADEAACLYRAKDTWAARVCLPKMFPDKPAERDCTTVMTRMREAVMTQVGSDGSAASRQLDKLLPVVKLACEQDAWPASVLRCIADTKSGDMEAFQRCSNQLPQEQQQKLAQRMTAALQLEPVPTEPPPPNAKAPAQPPPSKVPAQPTATPPPPTAKAPAQPPPSTAKAPAQPPRSKVPAPRAAQPPPPTAKAPAQPPPPTAKAPAQPPAK
jgi:hypothetical protein